jgi:aspartate 1-decarboxylase
MMREMFKSKIHRVRVTDGNLHYIGSITIDDKLMEMANIVENEKVLIIDLNNGARFETYVISGKRGSGIICLNGGGARLTLPGDLVIIISFTLLDENEIEGFKPKVIHVDEHNKPLE